VVRFGHDLDEKKHCAIPASQKAPRDRFNAGVVKGQLILVQMGFNKK
jgi:hypothetical protein